MYHGLRLLTVLISIFLFAGQNIFSQSFELLLPEETPDHQYGIPEDPELTSSPEIKNISGSRSLDFYCKIDSFSLLEISKDLITLKSKIKFILNYSSSSSPSNRYFLKRTHPFFLTEFSP